MGCACSVREPDLDHIPAGDGAVHHGIGGGGMRTDGSDLLKPVAERVEDGDVVAAPTDPNKKGMICLLYTSPSPRD